MSAFFDPWPPKPPPCRTKRCADLGIRAVDCDGYCQDCHDARAEDAAEARAEAAREARRLGIDGWDW